MKKRNKETTNFIYKSKVYTMTVNRSKKAERIANSLQRLKGELNG